MRRGAKRLLYLFVFLVLVAAGVAGYWYLYPEQARQNLEAFKEFLDSPRVRGFRWPSRQEGRFTVTFQDENIPEDYADALLRISLLTDRLLEEDLGRTFVRPISIYIFTRPGQHYFWTNGADEIHLCFEEANDLLPPGMGGERNHVAQIAHYLSLLVAQIRSGTGESPTPNDEATDALATYLEMNILVPGFWRAEKDLIWPAPYDYRRTSNPELYARFAAEPPGDMQADRFWTPWDTAWYRVHRVGGAKAVGQVLNAACGPVGHTDVEGLARAVEQITEREDVADFVRTLRR